MLTPQAPVGDDVAMGYGVFLRPDGAFGHGGGDPGVETLARFFPHQDLSAVMLYNVAGGCGEAWEELLGAVEGNLSVERT